MAEVSLSRRSLSDEPLSLTSIEIRSKDRRDSIWRCNFDLQGGEVIVFDSRKVHGNGVGSELSAELGAQLVLEHPAPGEPTMSCCGCAVFSTARVTAPSISTSQSTGGGDLYAVLMPPCALPARPLSRPAPTSPA
jgi:hypothetical protein